MEGADNHDVETETEAKLARRPAMTDSLQSRHDGGRTMFSYRRMRGGEPPWLSKVVVDATSLGERTCSEGRFQI